MKATLKIQLRRNRFNKNGTHTVGVYYSAYRKTTFISFDIAVLPEHWNDTNKTVKQREPRHLFYNQIIREKFNKADTIVTNHFHTPLSCKTFIATFLDKTFGNTCFYTFIENEIELVKTGKAEGTVANYHKLISTLKKFRPKLEFSDINLELIQKYHNYELSIGNMESTVYKKHANFKYLIGLAVDKELIEKNPYSKFEIKKNIKAENNDILSLDEIKLLQQSYDDNKYSAGKKEVLRDLLFSTYTGLSYADFSSMTYKDIKQIKHENGKTYSVLSNERQKTKIKFTIPFVLKEVIELAGTGSDIEKIFHPLSNQPTNRYLKEIMKDHEIDKQITFHRARHTFRTIAGRKGVRDSIIKKIMGHAEENDISEIYNHTTDEDIVNEMLGKWSNIE